MDTVPVLESIRDTSADLVACLFEQLNVNDRTLPPAIDPKWIQQHAHLTIPKHSISVRLQRLGLAARLRRRLVQTFETEVRVLHSDATSELIQACHNLRTSPDASLASAHQQIAQRLVASAQEMFERRVQLREDERVALCAEHCRQPPPRAKLPHPTKADSGTIVVKEEDVSDEDSLDVEPDPKQYHNMLEYIFRRGIEKPSRSDKMAFAAKTGLSYRTITVWFQNRRSRGALGGRCGWREKQRMRSLGMTDEQVLLLDELEPIISGSGEEPLESDSEIAESVTEVAEFDRDSAAEEDALSDLSEKEVEFNESEWETDLEDSPDVSTPFCGIRRVPSLTRSVSTSSSASMQLHHSASNSDIDVQSRASSPEPETSGRSCSLISIPPPAFNYRAARQLHSPSPAPSVHSKSPLLDDDAKLPPLDTPQLNAPFRLGSWRTNHNSGSLSQTLVTMRAPKVQQHTPSLSPSPVSDGEDQVLEAPSPTEFQDGPATPPTVTGFTFSSSKSAQPTNAQTQTPKQFVFGPSSSSSKFPVSQSGFDFAQEPSSSPSAHMASFTFSPQQTLLASSPKPKELFSPRVFGQRQSASPSTSFAESQRFTFGSTSPPPALASSPATPFKFNTVHAAHVGSSPSKFNFVPSPHPTDSRTSNARGSSGSVDNYSTPYTGGRQSSPTIVASQFSIPSPGVFDFSNPRPPNPEGDLSAKNVPTPAVFTFGMEPPADVQQPARLVRWPNEKPGAVPQKAVTAPFTFGKVDPRQPSTPFVFGSKNASPAETTPDCNVHPTASQAQLLPTTSKLPAVVRTPSSSASASSPVAVPISSRRKQDFSSSKPHAVIPQPTAPLAAKCKAMLVSTPRTPSTLPMHAAVARPLSRVPSSQQLPAPTSKVKGKGKMPMRDFFTTASTSRLTENVTQLDILADAALRGTTLLEDTELEAAVSVPLPASPPPRVSPLPLLNEYDDSDTDSDGDNNGGDDEPLMGNVLPPPQTTTSPMITALPISSAFGFSFPAPASLSVPRSPESVITEDIRRRGVSFSQNYFTPGVPQRLAAALGHRG